MQRSSNELEPSSDFETYFETTLIATLSPVALDLPFLTVAKLPLNISYLVTINLVIFDEIDLLSDHTFNFVVFLYVRGVDATLERVLCFESVVVS